MSEPGLGGIHQQALQVQQRGRVINGESADITNPGWEIRHHHWLAVGAGSKTALASTNPAEIAVRANLGNFRKSFRESLHSVSGLSRSGIHQIWVG